MGARQNQRVHGARHADVAEAALFFQLFGIHESARVREEALFESGKKDERKLESLGGVQRHQRDAGVGIVLVGVGGERGVVEELGQRFAADLGIVRGVGQFLQVFNAAEGLRRSLGFERLDVAGAVNEEADQLGQRGCIAGRAEALRTDLSSGSSSSELRFPGPRIRPTSSASRRNGRLDGFSANGEKWLASSSGI